MPVNQSEYHLDSTLTVQRVVHFERTGNASGQDVTMLLEKLLC